MTSLIGISGKLQSGKDTVTKIIQWLLLNQDKDTKIPFDKFDLYKEAVTWKNVKFADKLKDIVCLILGCTREQLEDPKFKESTLGEEWVKYELSYTSHDRLSYCNCSNYYEKYFRSKEKAVEYIEGNLEVDQDSIEISKIELTPRLLLQLLGTECGRQIIHPDIWVNSLMNEYNPVDRRTIQDPDDSNINFPNWIISDVRFPNEAKAVKDRDGILIRLNRNTRLDSVHESETSLDNYSDWDYVIENNGTIEDLIEKVKQILIIEGLLIE